MNRNNRAIAIALIVVILGVLLYTVMATGDGAALPGSDPSIRADGTQPANTNVTRTE